MADESDQGQAFVSGLGKGREGFHSEVTEFCLKAGERSPEDFIRHFPSSHIMKALSERPTERARILTEATGTHERVAHKMSPGACGEALQIALDEQVTTPADVMRLFQPDDRQRYLERQALWAFAIEGKPWQVKANDKPAFDRAKRFIAYVLDRALENMLLTHEELVEALTVAQLTSLLPREQLGAIISGSLSKSEKFTHAHLLEMVPPSNLVSHIPLDSIWDRVVVPLIAERHGYAAASAEAKGERAAGSSTAAANGDGASSATGKANSDVIDEDEIIEEEIEEAIDAVAPGVKKTDTGNQRGKQAKLG